MGRVQKAANLWLMPLPRDPASIASWRFIPTAGHPFYAGNYLDGSFSGQAGKVYPLRSGLCLETQVFPTAPIIKGKKDEKLRLEAR